MTEVTTIEAAPLAGRRKATLALASPVRRSARTRRDRPDLGGAGPHRVRRGPLDAAAFACWGDPVGPRRHGRTLAPHTRHDRTRARGLRAWAASSEFFSAHWRAIRGFSAGSSTRPFRGCARYPPSPGSPFHLWLGIFEASKIALIAVGVFFPVYLGVMGASVRGQKVGGGRPHFSPEWI